MWLPSDIIFLECPSGFKNMANDLGGSQEWTEGEGITTCEAACDARSGCTAFEYNHAGEENYKCGTYTGDWSDIVTTNTGGNAWSTEGYQRSTWTTCTKWYITIIILLLLLLLLFFNGL